MGSGHGIDLIGSQLGNHKLSVFSSGVGAPHNFDQQLPDIDVKSPWIQSNMSMPANDVDLYEQALMSEPWSSHDLR